MASEEGIKIAADGVAEVTMARARAHLTALIRDVRYGGQVGAFTERGTRRAYLVTPDAYDQARTDHYMVEWLRKTHPDLYAEYSAES